MDIFLGALLFRNSVVLGYPLRRNDLVAVLISFSIRDLKKSLAEVSFPVLVLQLDK